MVSGDEFVPQGVLGGCGRKTQLEHVLRRHLRPEALFA
jgi:hypothetical protein